MHNKHPLRLSTTHIILLSFLALILMGSLLLSLPISAANGISVPYTDALFTATTSVCVTGLVTLPTASTWSIFGQAVILLLIQVGGLGVVATLSAVMILFQRKISLGDRLLLPIVMLRDKQNVFLDDVTPEDLEKELGVAVRALEIDGGVFLDAVLEQEF